MQPELRDVTDALPYLVWTCLAEGLCDYPNRQWVEYTGIPEAEQLGYGWLTQLHPDDLGRVKAEWATAVGRGVTFDIEFRIRRADGVYRWFKTRAIPLRDPGSKIVKWCGSNADVDDYKRHEETLHESEARLTATLDKVSASEERYRRLFESAKDGILILDADTGRIVDVNPFMTELTGYSSDDFLAKHLWEVGPFKDIAASKVSFAELQTNEYVRYEDLPLATRAGGTVEVEFVSNVYLVGGVKVIQCNVRDVSARKRAQTLLRESEDEYRAVVGSVSDTIVVIDQESRIIRFVSDSVGRTLGYSAAELVGEELTILMPTRYRADHRAGVKRYAETGVKKLDWRGSQVVGLHKNGKEIPLEIAYGEYVKNGQLRIVGVIRDVSALRREEGAHRLFRALIDKSNDIVEVVDPETGRFLDVNERGCVELGYTRDEYLALSVPDVDPGVGSFREGANALRTSGFLRREGLHRRKDGSTFPVEVSVSLVRLDREYAVAVVRDITDSKAADAERLLLTTAIEQADESVVVTDAQGNIVYVNPTFEALTKYSRAEALGRNMRLVKSGAHDEAFYRTLWETITAGKVWRGRCVNRKKDGTLYTLDGTISPVRNADGIITNYVAVRRDVTAALALEAQFRQAQKMEAVGRLAGGVAHDFNNVLSVILSYAELVGGDLAPDEPARADMEEIRKAALRAADLTRQLLAFSRQQVLEAKVLNLNRSIAEMEKMLHRLIGADVDLVMLHATGLGNVKADPSQIEQILMNLFVNARDAMPQGGKLTIETANVELDDDYASAHANVRTGSYVMLAVSDTGAGMDAKTQARLFEPFFTTKENGKGTGLGLATVFGIVAQSEGHIWVYSEPGKGTTFKIYFPRTGGAVEVGTSPRPAPEPTRGSETILLVEDDDQVRALARNILRRNGYVVLEAPNGGEALLICEQHGAKIHLLLTDVILPRMSGRQLADRLAPLRPEMKLLFMSGYTDDAILQHGILESGVAFLQKPLTPSSLTRKVREVLDGPKGRE